MEKHTLGNLIPYANGTLSDKDRKKVISSLEPGDEYINRKKREKEFLLDLIPEKRLSAIHKRQLIQKMFVTTDDLIPKEKFPIINKVKKFLNKPVVSIKY